jgi:hypothetical protein
MSSGIYVKCLLFLLDFNETWIFSNDYSTNTHISNFMKILPVAVELSHADRHDEGKGSFFCNFANALENGFRRSPSVLVCVSLVSSCKPRDLFPRNYALALCIGRHRNIMILNLLFSVIMAWRTRKPIRRERHQRHSCLDPEMVYSNSSEKYVADFFYDKIFVKYKIRRRTNALGLVVY